MVKPMNGQSWRQFLKFDKIDVCACFSAGHDNAYIQSIRQNYNHLFPQLPKACPVMKGNYSARNVTLLNGLKSEPDAFLSTQLPNGVYRHTLRFYTESDPEGFMVYWHIEQYDSMGEDRF